MKAVFFLRRAHAHPRLDINVVIHSIYIRISMMDHIVFHIPHKAVATDDSPDGEQTYISTPDFLESVIARARMLGKKIGVKYGEGFTSEKLIGIKNLDALVQIET